MSAKHMPSTILRISLLAGLAGALSALLLAPSSGRETRALLKSKVQHHQSEAEGEHEDGTMAAILREEQERMRLNRENKRQLPVLTNWEREL